MTNKASISKERWKTVEFGFTFSNDYELHVSNMGNIKAFNKFSRGGTLRGSTVNGYRIIRIKFFKPRDKKIQASLSARHQEIVVLRERIKKLDSADRKKNKEQIVKGKARLEMMQGVLRKKRQQDIYERTIHYHSLVHRLVATYFVSKKSSKHMVVGHLDHNKLNNGAANLKWMTPEENYAHQQSSPLVIKEKKDRNSIYRDSPRGAKLSVDKVRELKKLLAAGEPVKGLVKKFKVSDTQILRIRRGEHWGHVNAGE